MKPRGGARKGAGAPPKDPSGEIRRKTSYRLPVGTISALKILSDKKTGHYDSQADVIVEAVTRLTEDNVKPRKRPIPDPKS